MKNYRYLPGVASLRLDRKRCIGCEACATVCPHRVFDVKEGKARILDGDLCMECGACALNCPVGAVSVSPGVGCAEYIIKTWLRGKSKAHARCC